MAPSPDERPNSVPWPPLIYAGALIAGLLLHWAAPLPWPSGALRLPLAVAGLGLAGWALMLYVTAARAFRRHQTTIHPNRAATALITDGPFANSRNPLYVANTLLLSAAALVFGVAWLLPAALAAAILTQKLAIEREERHLAARFGQGWADYAARTPRWLFWR